ncbi:MAG: hypothetical protein FWF02_11525 [Micrococcales bacterium]|nr:hypothetical protein [Micrococcales bacterium]MCL2668316.1 hypothetical protein [Micrococcales bacterium]
MTPPRLTFAVTALALAVTGCTNKDPDPAPPTNPPATTATTTTKPDPKRAAEKEAIEAYKAYKAAYNKTAQNYYKDHAPLIWLTCDQYTLDLSPLVQALQAAGAHQVGGDKVSNFKVIDHQAVRDFPIDDHVTFEVCVDSSGTDVVLPDGSSALRPGTTGRFVATVTMWHQDLSTIDPDVEPGGQWLVAAGTVDRGRTC